MPPVVGLLHEVAGGISHLRALADEFCRPRPTWTHQFRPFEIVENLAFSFVPTAVITVMMTTAIRPAMRPYSIAVAPLSLRRNLSSIVM